ncbi:uncharacterized protein [Typha angustifolia]|uniref:uncharacterized protein isoform X2 n=1 Tax=Typha angustifolia TaxID=59011 RepID=UPI003C2B6406
MPRPAAVAVAAAARAARTTVVDGAVAASSVSTWRIIPRPLLETVLNNHAHHHRVHQPLLFHGPRGVGKTSILLHRLLPEWNKGPHVTAYVDFAADPSATPPWSFVSSSSCATADLATLRNRLELSLEALVDHAVRLGAIGSRDVFTALNKWSGLDTALRRVIGSGRLSRRDEKAPASSLWVKAVVSRLSHVPGVEIDEKKYSREEVAYMREAAVALRLAKDVLGMQQEWRKEAVRHLNRTGGFSRSLANLATDWPCLLLEILSEAAQIDFFQPKLILNNIDVLRKATSADDSIVPAAVYHDSLIWRVIALGANEKCLPVILATSDSYYSYQAFVDFGFPDIFISRETFGWTHQEAKLHMVPDLFSEQEWKVIDEVLGPNPRQLSELYMLKQSKNYADFEDTIDAYLAYLQVAVLNPAMESALAILEKFASDARERKIPEGRLHFGAPWRHPPHSDSPVSSLKWAKFQLMDFVQSFINTEFGVNYLADYSLEILDDPAAVAMLEVGLLYAQRDPSYIRPVTRGIERCLVRWLVQQKMQMSLPESISYIWQRIIRGRSYRHLMKK